MAADAGLPLLPARNFVGAEVIGHWGQHSGSNRFFQLVLQSLEDSTSDFPRLRTAGQVSRCARPS